MIDSSKLLRFKVRRALTFHWPRGVGFNIDRELGFDQNRDLLFDVNRDLEIRLRGVLFRGKTCPKCDALVILGTFHCDECGYRFKKWHKAELYNESRIRASKTVAGSDTVDASNTVKTTDLRKDHGIEVIEDAVDVEDFETAEPDYHVDASQAMDTFYCPSCNTHLYSGTQRCPICGMDFTPAPPEPRDSRLKDFMDSEGMDRPPYIDEVEGPPPPRSSPPPPPYVTEDHGSRSDHSKKRSPWDWEELLNERNGE